MDPMFGDLRGYLQLATGLTEATASKAREAVMSLMGQGLNLSTKAPDVVGQVQELADDLMSTSKNNREMLLALIRTEVDRAVGRMGFVREDELAALRRHVQRLEEQVHDLSAAERVPESAASATETDVGSEPGTDVGEPVIKKKKIMVDPLDTDGGHS